MKKKQLINIDYVSQKSELSDQDYEMILKIIRHEVRCLETLPGTFGQLPEEKLRDIVLAHLHGYFISYDNGMNFSVRNKTAIFIGFEEHVVFGARCKYWRGRHSLDHGVFQLTYHSTAAAPYSKAALLLWNTRVKKPEIIQQKISKFFCHSPGYIRSENSGHQGEWRAVFRSDDEKREILIHFFLVNLYS